MGIGDDELKCKIPFMLFKSAYLFATFRTIINLLSKLCAISLLFSQFITFNLYFLFSWRSLLCFHLRLLHIPKDPNLF